MAINDVTEERGKYEVFFCVWSSWIKTLKNLKTKKLFLTTYVFQPWVSLPVLSTIHHVVSLLSFSHPGTGGIKQSGRSCLCLRACIFTMRLRMHTHGFAVAFLYVRALNACLWQNEIIYWQNSYTSYDPLYLKFWAKLIPFLQKRLFSINFRFSIFVSAVTPSEKVQLSLRGSPLRTFPWALMNIVRCT